MGLGLLAVPAVLMAVAHRSLKNVALYSEEQVKRASVLHPLFNSAEHFAAEHWRPSMTQRERLQGITEAYAGTVQALTQIGLSPFLESSSLIGLLRHGGHMPWEVDGDLGVVESECREKGATKEALQAAISGDLEVLKFACSCEEDCEGDNLRMAGRVAHRGTGVCIDIFMYAPVGTLRPWQRAQNSTHTEWWERVDDHADYTFPREMLLPLKHGTFEGIPMMLPRQPKEFLSWEYGRCLGIHIWPWRLLLYCPTSVMIPIAICAKGVALFAGSPACKGHRPSPWVGVLSGVYSAVALGAFQGGITLMILLITWVCEMVAIIIVPELIGVIASRSNKEGMTIRKRYRLVQLVALAAVALELRGCLGQLACQVDDFYFNPLRPKTWTLCLFGQCWDF